MCHVLLVVATTSSNSCELACYKDKKFFKRQIPAFVRKFREPINAFGYCLVCRLEGYVIPFLSLICIRFLFLPFIEVCHTTIFIYGTTNK